ncbi:MAG: glycosyltransferase [Nitrosarchaeum sp.]|nr:glycosyltransferase [Nitrosarchaeum sp.]
MKILKVNFNVGGYAGDNHEILTVAKELRELGHEVDLATSDADAFYFDKEKSQKYSTIRKRLLDADENNPIIIDDISVYVTHCISNSLGMFCPNATNFAKKLIPKYDVIHIYNWYYHLGFVFAKIAKKYNVPYVYAADGGLLEGAHNLKKTRKNILDLVYTKNMLRNLSGALSLGESESKDYIKRGVHPSKIFRIDNIFILEDFKIKEGTDIFKKIGIDVNKQPYISYVARIDKKKGIDLLLKAFAGFCKTQKKYFLVIAGTGTKKYEQEIKKLTKDLGISENVKFAGYVTNDEKYQLIKESKFYAHTSRSDVHPHAIGDALIMGAPVLITEPCDYPEVRDYNAGKIVNVDIDEIQNAIGEMLADENKLKEYSKNARKIMEDCFQMKDHVKKYEEMYLTVIKNFREIN